MTTFPEIATSRCVLNRVTVDDLPVIQEVFNDTQTQMFLLELCGLLGLDNGIPQFISVFDAYMLENEGILWAIRHREKLIGFVGIIDFSLKPTLFYAMHSDYRLKGFMKEAIEAVIGFVCSNNLCCSLQSEVYKENLISINLLQSVGFDVMEADGQKFYLRKDLACCG